MANNFCSNCGYKLESNTMKFCPECGSPTIVQVENDILENAGDIQEEVVDTVSDVDGSSKAKMLGGWITMLIFGVILIVSFYNQTTELNYDRSSAIVSLIIGFSLFVVGIVFVWLGNNYNRSLPYYKRRKSVGGWVNSIVFGAILTLEGLIFSSTNAGIVFAIIGLVLLTIGIIYTVKAVNFNRIQEKIEDEIAKGEQQ